MSPTLDSGVAPADLTPTTLDDRMLAGEFGPLIPAASARARMQMTEEALRRYGDQVEDLLCTLPTGSAGGRMYPEELLVLMAQARAQRESGRARSRRAALVALLTARGWVPAAPDEAPGDPALSEMVADLRAVSWRLSEVAPQLGGMIEEHRDVIADLSTTLNRVTLELPQAIPHLERIRLANESVTASARELGHRTAHLTALTADLDARIAAHHRQTRMARTIDLAALWPLGVAAGTGSLAAVLIARLIGL